MKKEPEYNNNGDIVNDNTVPNPILKTSSGDEPPAVNPTFGKRRTSRVHKRPASMSKKPREDGSSLGFFSKASAYLKQYWLYIVGSFAFIAFILSYFIFTSALVIKYLWLWFAVPLGLPAIGYVHSMGISLFVSYFLTADKTSTLRKEYKEDTPWWWTVLLPWTFLLIGWILHRCM